jgi:hypothetical protein
MTRQAERLLEVLRYGLRWLDHRTYGQADDLAVGRQLFNALAAYEGLGEASGREAALVCAGREVFAFVNEHARIAAAARIAGVPSWARTELGERVRAAVLAYDDVEPAEANDRLEWRKRLETAAVLAGVRV